MSTLINWFEIPATDIKRAKEFYGSLLDIELNLQDCGEEKMAFFPDNAGAISLAPDFNPSKDGILIYLPCAEGLEKTFEKAKKLGAGVIREITKIEAPDAGSFALILDSEGNRIGLYDPKA